MKGRFVMAFFYTVGGQDREEIEGEGEQDRLDSRLVLLVDQPVNLQRFRLAGEGVGAAGDADAGRHPYTVVVFDAIGTTLTEQSVVLTVSDTGPGPP